MTGLGLNVADQTQEWCNRVTRSSPAPAQADGEQRFDAKHGFLTPGLVDTHSHLCLSITPRMGTFDGNEMTNPITSGIRAEEAFGPRTWH